MKNNYLVYIFIIGAGIIAYFLFFKNDKKNEDKTLEERVITLEKSSDNYFQMFGQINKILKENKLIN